MAENAPRPTDRRAVPVACAGTLLALAVFTAPMTALRETTRGLHAGALAQTWILSGIGVGLASGLLVAGVLGDRLGRRRVFVLGAALLSAATFACAISHTPLQYVSARFAEGLGSAGVISCGLGLIGHAVPPGPARSRATGLWGASVGAGTALGPVLSAVLTSTSGWRSTYWVEGAACTVLTAAAVSVRESQAQASRRLDWPGATLLSGGILLLVTGLTLGRSGWAAPTSLLSLAAAAVVFRALWAVESRRSDPLLEPGLFADPRFRAVTLGSSFTGLSIIALMTYLPVFLTRGYGSSALSASLCMAVWSTTSIVAALGARRLPSRYMTGLLLAAGLSVSAVGEVLMAVTAGQKTWTTLVPGLLVAGVASGVLNAALGRGAIESVPPDRSAMGSGANNTARYVGSSAGVAIQAAVLAAHTGNLNWTDALRAASLTGAGLAAAGALLIHLCNRQARRHSHAPAARAAVRA